MTTRDETIHREVSDLLTWYLNKTLSAAEMKKVETHLAMCSDCQKALQAVAAFQSAVVASNNELPKPSDDLMTRVMDRVDAFEKERSRSKGSRLGEWFAGFGFTLPRLAMAQLAAIVVLAVAVGFLTERAAHFKSVSLQERQRADLNQAALDQEREKFRSLAESHPELSQVVARIKVAFNDSATDKQIRELLGEIEGSITAA